MTIKKVFSYFIIFISTYLFSPLSTADDMLGKWQNIRYSISGLARIQPAKSGSAYSFLAVIDSKNSTDPRTLMINLDSNYKLIGAPIVLPWRNGYPSNLSDLESVAAVPNTSGSSQQFVATTSSGYYWRFTINSSYQIDNVVTGDGRLTQSGSTSSAKEIESIAFFINQDSGNTKIVWSSRGSRDHSSRMYAADFENNSSQIGFNDSNQFKVQEGYFNWPRPVWSDDGGTRLTSDLKIANNGATYVTSAFDGGNNGPFGSTLYNTGTFVSASNFVFNNQPFIPLAPLFIRGSGKKVEALELLTGVATDGFIVGTDDENLGGYIMVAKFQ